MAQDFRCFGATFMLAAYVAGMQQEYKQKAPVLARRGLWQASRDLQVGYMPESVRISMTRRFSWRPSSVALSAIGALSPLPTELMRAGSTPREDR